MVLVACVRAVCVALSRCVWSAGREVSRPLAPLLRLGTDPPSPRDEDHVESRSDPFFAEILRFRSELDLRSLRSLRPEVVPPSGLSRERSTTLSSSSSGNRALRSRLRWVPVSVRDRRSGDSVWLTRTLRGNRIDASPGAAAPRWARLRVFGCVCSGSTTQRRTPRVK